MGRPNGQKIAKLSLKPIVPQLQTYLNRKVTFLQDCVGQSILSQIKSTKNQIFLCQNVRFHPQQVGHIKNQDGSKTKIQHKKIQQFKNELSKLGTCFINDGFGTVHRAHCSVIGINHKFRVAGYLMQKQLNVLGQFVQNPKRPVLAILGGAKVQDKLMLVKNMLQFADEIVLGGAMQNPFLNHVYKKQLGASLNIMPDDPQQLVQIINISKKYNKKIHFPMDYQITPKQQMTNPKEIKIIPQSQPVPTGYQILDNGPQAGKQMDKIISRAGSIFWNGPVGMIQVQPFKKGSVDILNSMIKATKNGATTIIGGGDSASLVTKIGVQEQLSFVSTGGGATIELFQGKQLPGIRALSTINQLK